MSEIENNKGILNWTKLEVSQWGKEKFLSEIILQLIYLEEIDGKTILSLTENDIRDLRYKLNYNLKFGDIKNFWLEVRKIQKQNPQLLNFLGLHSCSGPSSLAAASTAAVAGIGTSTILNEINPNFHHQQHQQHMTTNFSPYIGHLVQCSSHTVGAVGTSVDLLHLNVENERVSPPMSVDGRATSVPPEFFKTFISLGYSFLVTWVTAFTMVVVHERVPDMKKYPPLPDIFLDNVPHIPWAFHMCEITGTLLFTIWASVCIFHKYRMVLLRRFFGIAGTVFLLRCVTMLITSLSVPGTHLQCNPNDYKVDDSNLTIGEAIELRVSRAYTIWSGLGMSIQGVRTCGDYMFSGHTVALTLLNFFITEYTPRNFYFLHTMTWLLNMFGIFFILAAHEHYSIDVFVAFYITSRLFLYYHTLANNQALMSHDSNRTRIWFPMFSYFESSVDGIIPNEYDNIPEKLIELIICLKDSIMLTARRFWLESENLKPKTLLNSFNASNVNSETIDNNLSTSTINDVTTSSSSQKSITDQDIPTSNKLEKIKTTIKYINDDELKNRFDQQQSKYKIKETFLKNNTSTTSSNENKKLDNDDSIKNVDKKHK